MEKKNRYLRIIAFFLAINIFFEVASPTVALALTNGSYQPEYETFEPAGATDMVDLFTGDFKYNIPLLDVEGYPVNLFYHAGATMEQEASWVGLGWNLNVGSSNRFLKGLPDDFNGDQISTTFNVKKNETWSAGFVSKLMHNSSIGAFGVSVGPGQSSTINTNLVYNNYKGYGIEVSYDQDRFVSGGALVLGGGMSRGVGVKISSLDGGEFSTREGKFWGVSHFYSENVGVGTTHNTRTGLEYKNYYSSQSKVIMFDVDGIQNSILNGSLATQNGLKSQLKNNQAAAVNFVLHGGHDNQRNEVVQQVPVSSTAYQPRIEFDRTGKGNAAQLLQGFYGCIGINLSVFGINFVQYRVKMQHYLVLVDIKVN